jgi:hypothetical protein
MAQAKLGFLTRGCTRSQSFHPFHLLAALYVGRQKPKTHLGLKKSQSKKRASLAWWSDGPGLVHMSSQPMSTQRGVTSDCIQSATYQWQGGRIYVLGCAEEPAAKPKSPPRTPSRTAGLSSGGTYLQDLVGGVEAAAHEAHQVRHQVLAAGRGEKLLLEPLLVAVLMAQPHLFTPVWLGLVQEGPRAVCKWSSRDLTNVTSVRPASSRPMKRSRSPSGRAHLPA